MLKEEMLIQIFNDDTSGKNYLKGQRIINNDLVSSIDITNEDYLICIDGNVISENLFNEYHTKIEMDVKKKGIVSTFCSCMDFEKNEFNKTNYCCKHLVATFYKALEELLSHPSFKEENLFVKNTNNNKNNLLSFLVGDMTQSDELKVEVYLNKDQWTNNIKCEFKVGNSSMSSNSLYILKDINHFLLAIDNNYPITYSKNFTFQIKNYKLSVKDKRLIDFIKMLKEIEGTTKYYSKLKEKIIDGKYIIIPSFLIREFLEVVKNHKIYLNEGFFYRTVETEILYQAPMVDFDLKLVKDNYVLKSPNGMPLVLGAKNDVFLYGTTIYLPEYEYCYKITPYLQVFNSNKVITLESYQEDVILRKLIPDLSFLSTAVTLSKGIKEKIVIDECKFNFYFNKEGEEFDLTVKVKYGQFEFNIFEDCFEKVIYRDSKKEAYVIGVIRALGFEEINNKFYLLKGEAYAFRFFKNEIVKLQQLGEVFYSENFKGIKSIGSKGISADIHAGKYNYFELGFKIGDINHEETKKILRAFRNNLKYYKLKSGEYLDLEELELNKFLKLLDVVAPKELNENLIEIAKSKGVFINNYLEENEIRYIKGKAQLKEITSKLNNIDKLNFKVPEELSGILRDYQKVGYNWFKTLDFLGFGGILGDEMGLGKTLQAITFILSNKSSKSLIVAPTSLIYNWGDEFRKFAPSVKLAIINGTKDEREEVIKNIDEFNVIVTTYNLLKRDIESYKKLEFDYFILDEAQYIKNSHSQNAMTVKEIKAKSRFALSGTPIENSLMELWSIFDFIMPNYLFDEKRFSVRYHKKLKESPEVIEELNKLIKPFILRRRKKDVIKELPDKIETTLLVNLEDEQKQVYKTYANYAVSLIEKKVREEEFKNSKIEILSYLTKLRQLCLDPSVVMENYVGNSGKIEALIEMLHQIIGEGHRVLVFSQFTSVLKNIGKRMDIEGITYSYLDGAIPPDKRIDMVKAFNKGVNSVFLISLKAGGTGLNLTSADVVIHFDPWWNPAVENQATDRAHRIGQENVVEVIKIIAKGTIEEKMLLLQEEKKKLIEGLMGDEFSSGESLQALSEEEILNLFNL